MELRSSQTLQNLMRAFSGETQAWARYTFAAQAAVTQGFPNMERLFRYTAEQEKEHAELLWTEVKRSGASEAGAPGSYPVDPAGDMLSLLRLSSEHEYREAGEVYPAFAETAETEGFADLALRFRQLAAIERLHGDRFARFAERLGQGTLFRAPAPVPWLCLNCGHVAVGTEPPAKCPVCSHEQGYFLPLELTPFQ